MVVDAVVMVDVDDAIVDDGDGRADVVRPGVL